MKTIYLQILTTTGLMMALCGCESSPPSTKLSKTGL